MFCFYNKSGMNSLCEYHETCTGVVGQEALLNDKRKMKKVTDVKQNRQIFLYEICSFHFSVADD